MKDHYGIDQQKITFFLYITLARKTIDFTRKTVIYDTNSLP